LENFYISYFESTFLVKYDTASAITGEDSTISSIESSTENRLIKWNDETITEVI